MSVAGGVWARGRGYMEQRYPKLLRRLPPVLVAGLGAVLLAWGFGKDTPTAVLVGMACLPLWVLALSWPVWRAPEEGLPQLMLWRRRQRRIFGRVAVLMLMAAGVGVMMLGYSYEKDATSAQHAWTSAAAWLAALSPVPVLLDPLVWQVWTRPFRGAVRAARVLMYLQDPRRFADTGKSRRPAPGFDPDQGFCGRPNPVHRNQPPYHRGEPRSCSGHGMPGDQLSVVWDGEAIALRGRDGQQARVPIDQVAELVTVSEYDQRRGTEQLLVLDREGRRLVSLNRIAGLKHNDLSKLASAAGVPYADYELGFAADANFVVWKLFPAAKGHRRLL